MFFCSHNSLTSTLAAPEHSGAVSERSKQERKTSQPHSNARGLSLIAKLDKFQQECKLHSRTRIIGGCVIMISHSKHFHKPHSIDSGAAENAKQTIHITYKMQLYTRGLPPIQVSIQKPLIFRLVLDGQNRARELGMVPLD